MRWFVLLVYIRITMPKKVEMIGMGVMLECVTKAPASAEAVLANITLDA